MDLLTFGGGVISGFALGIVLVVEMGRRSLRRTKRLNAKSTERMYENQARDRMRQFQAAAAERAKRTPVSVVMRSIDAKSTGAMLRHRAEELSASVRGAQCSSFEWSALKALRSLEPTRVVRDGGEQVSLQTLQREFYDSSWGSVWTGPREAAGVVPLPEVAPSSPGE